jgi:hypothetical protein
MTRDKCRAGHAASNANADWLICAGAAARRAPGLLSTVEHRDVREKVPNSPALRRGSEPRRSRFSAAAA